MIRADFYQDGFALLRCNNKNYGFHITEVEHSYGGFGRSEIKVSGTVLDTFKESNKLVGVRKTYAIERVIFNDPATIVIWSDKTKTVVKCQPGDAYDREKGLALCIAKKFLGNKGSFNNVFKKYLGEEVEKC